LKVKVEVGLKVEITCLTQHLGLSIFDLNNNPALFRLHTFVNTHSYFGWD